MYPHLPVIAGNVATGAATETLIECGVGMRQSRRPWLHLHDPYRRWYQRTADRPSMNVLKSLNYGIPIVADGGIKYSGDMAKAIAAGGNVVMMGNLLARLGKKAGRNGHHQGRSYKEYRGMGSGPLWNVAVRTVTSGEDAKLVPEGHPEGHRVPYKGPAADTIYQMVGESPRIHGLCGCHNIKMIENTQFIQITITGLH